MVSEYEKKLEEFIEDIKSWRSKLNPDKCFSVNQVEYLSEWGKDIFDEGYRKAREEIKDKIEVMNFQIDIINAGLINLKEMLKELGLSEEEKYETI